MRRRARCGAASGAVNLAAVAAAADQQPERGSRRTETAGLTRRRHGRSRRRHVDERHDCRDTVPACVPSTVWGTASMQNLPVEIGAVLALQVPKLPRHRPQRHGEHATHRGITPDDMPAPIQQLRASPSLRGVSRHTFGQFAPEKRGSGQPATPPAPGVVVLLFAVDIHD